MSILNVPVSSNQKRIQETVQQPQWLDKQLYPFQSHFVEIEGNRIHYIDEGSGPIVLFVHPGFGWSFTNREIIKGLRDRYRCIALDLPGFGLSPASPTYRHTLIGDSRLIERFIQTLALTDITLFGQDITGSAAFGVMGRRPEEFRAAIILEGFLWSVKKEVRVYPMIQLVGSPFLRWLSNTFNFFIEYSLATLKKKGQQKFSAQEMKAYRGPMLKREVRRHPHDLFSSATRSDDYLVDLEKRLQSLKGMPALLIFSDAEIMVKMGWLQHMEQLFPKHRSIVLQGSHHFPQEYDPASVVTEIRRWLDEEIGS
ncbi:MAG TPA: alpha/beta fold hydrolase [Ktedonobacteraceae bacterium]|nr:alpha/beta fold hydrolase [Ktedonobacteraceae bacterium]